jgi:DNA-directed RNA polymerase specialized sigma24 family protein
LADEALDRLARKLNEGETIRQLPGYLAGIARLILQEEWSKARRDGKNSRQVLVAPAVSSDNDLDWEAIESCLSMLPAESRELIQRYYSADGRALSRSRSRTAEELGISLNALRNRALRIRRELEKCAEKP